MQPASFASALAKRWLAAAAALLCCATPANAAETEASDWRFAVTLYGWISDLEGDLNASPATHPVAIDFSHGDILDHLKFAAFGSFDARKDRLVFLTDFTYAHLGASRGIGIRDTDLIDAELDATAFTTTLLGGYRVAQGPADVDLMIGGRLVVADTDLVLTGPQRTVDADVTRTWIDPIVATRVGIPLHGRTSLALYADAGAGASDFTWQAMLGIQHRVSSRWTLSAAWRHYAVDYDKDSFLYDVKQSGPVIGASFEF